MRREEMRGGRRRRERKMKATSMEMREEGKRKVREGKEDEGTLRDRAAKIIN